MERKELDWPVRSIRLPDELWYYFVEQAAKEKISTSEYIRNILIKKSEE
jgi:hypothetical protein